jgi:hypothetical protein
VTFYFIWKLFRWLRARRAARVAGDDSKGVVA